MCVLMHIVLYIFLMHMILYIPSPECGLFFVCFFFFFKKSALVGVHTLAGVLCISLRRKWVWFLL